MGRFWDWLSGARAQQKRADAELLKSLLDLQKTRLETDEKLATVDGELRLKTKQLELEHLERIGEEKRKDSAMRQELRQKRREYAIAGKAAQKLRKEGLTNGLDGCKVCRNPSDPSLTAHEITWHTSGHPGAANHVA